MIVWYESMYRCSFACLFGSNVEENADIIKAISYINANWDAQAMWQGRDWGNSRMQDNEEIASRWRKAMNSEPYFHGVDGIYELIGFD